MAENPKQNVVLMVDDLRVGIASSDDPVTVHALAELLSGYAWGTVEIPRAKQTFDTPITKQEIMSFNKSRRGSIHHASSMIIGLYEYYRQHYSLTLPWKLVSTDNESLPLGYVAFIRPRVFFSPTRGVEVIRLLEAFLTSKGMGFLTHETEACQAWFKARHPDAVLKT